MTERERERGRDREREREIQIDRQRDRETEKDKAKRNVKETDNRHACADRNLLMYTSTENDKALGLS